MNKILKSTVIAFITIFSLQTLTGCFGKFSLVRKVYDFNSKIMGNDLLGRFVKTVVSYAFIPVYGIAYFVDFVALNLVEFWTGTNPLAMRAGETETQFITFKGIEYKMTATKDHMTILQLSGENAGKQTDLVYNKSEASLSVIKDGKTIKVANITINEVVTAETADRIGNI